MKPWLYVKLFGLFCNWCHRDFPKLRLKKLLVVSLFTMSLLSWAQAYYCMLLKAVFSHFSSSNGIPLHPSKAGPVLGLSWGVCPHAEGLWVEPARKVQHLGPDVRNQSGPDPEQLRLRAPTDFAVPENHRPFLPGESDPAFICFWTFCRRRLVISFKLGLLTILWSRNPCSILWFFMYKLCSFHALVSPVGVAILFSIGHYLENVTY